MREQTPGSVSLSNQPYLAASLGITRVRPDRAQSNASVPGGLVLGVTRTLEQLEDNLLAADLHLSEEDTSALDEASDLTATDYPYGELGLNQRARVLASD